MMGDGQQTLLLTSHHYYDHPNQFLLLDAKGAVAGEYWHSGHLEHMAAGDLDGDGVQEILLGGVNNGQAVRGYGATLVVLDPRRVSGASRQPPGDPDQLLGFRPGTEKAVLRFPRSCVNGRHGDHNAVAFVGVNQNLELSVHVEEIPNDAGSRVIYELDRNFRIKSVMFPDLLKPIHQRLESQGHCDRTAAEEELYLRERIEVVFPEPPGQAEIQKESAS